MLALRPRAGGYRVLWAVHVKPVGRITGWYMRLIDPFRARIVYPTVLRIVEEAWSERYGGSAAG